MPVRNAMRETDADLGYIRQYAAHLHADLERGEELPPEVVAKVRAALAAVRDAYCLNVPRRHLASGTTA